MSARIVVHSLDHALAAASAAAALGKPVTLASAPGAACYAGPRWFLALVAEARARHPTANITECADCADEPGTVLAALRAGARRVIFTGRADIRAKLAQIAAATGATVDGEDQSVTLDLLDATDPEAACHAFLTGR